MPDWRPRTVPGDWLAVDLFAIYSVTKLAVQGRHNADYNVKTFKLSYSMDGDVWTFWRRGSQLVSVTIPAKSRRQGCKFQTKIHHVLEIHLSF